VCSLRARCHIFGLPVWLYIQNKNRSNEGGGAGKERERG